MKNIYLAGPMTGLPDYNYKAFLDAAESLREATGCQIVHTANAPRGYSHQDYMHWSIDLLRCCHAIAVLPGYESSKGAQQELAAAKTLELAVYYMPDDWGELLRDAEADRED